MKDKALINGEPYDPNAPVGEEKSNSAKFICTIGFVLLCWLAFYMSGPISDAVRHLKGEKSSFYYEVPAGHVGKIMKPGVYYKNGNTIWIGRSKGKNE